MRRIHALVLLGAPALLCMAGCGGGIERYQVSGTVTYDGQAVERGEVSFEPEDRSKAPEGGVIEDGKFRFQVVPGKKTVRIHGSRRLPPGPHDDPDSGPMYEDYIPDCYHTKSTLKVEVKPGGDNVFPFELKSR